jgi:hypothetical protein
MLRFDTQVGQHVVAFIRQWWVDMDVLEKMLLDQYRRELQLSQRAQEPEGGMFEKDAGEVDKVDLNVNLIAQQEGFEVREALPVSQELQCG